MCKYGLMKHTSPRCLFGKILLGQGKDIGSNPIAYAMILKGCVFMREMILICKSIVWVTSIAFLLIAIKTKKRSMLNCVRWVTLGSLFYLLVDVFGLWYYLFDVDYGLEVILGWIHSAVSAVLLIAAHIIALVKRKKYEMQPGEDIQRWPLLYLLVAVCFFSCFALEYEVLQDANIIIPHSPSSWDVDEYGLVITDVTALPIQVGDRYYKEGQTTECYWYSVNVIDDQIQITSYDDPELKDIDISIVKSLCASTEYTKLATDSQYTIPEYDIIHIRNTDYYLVRYMLANAQKTLSTTCGCAVFLKDQFVADIDEIPESDFAYVYPKEDACNEDEAVFCFCSEECKNEFDC